MVCLSMLASQAQLTGSRQFLSAVLRQWASLDYHTLIACLHMRRGHSLDSVYIHFSMCHSTVTAVTVLNGTACLARIHNSTGINI